MASEADARTLSSFFDYLRVERGSAKLTIAAYGSDLAQFADFLQERKRNLTGARRDDVREFIQELFANSLDGRSVGRKLSAIRHLYRQLLLDGKIDKDPTLNIDLPKQWKVLPKALSRAKLTPCFQKRIPVYLRPGIERRPLARWLFAIALCSNCSMPEGPSLRNRRCASRRLEARNGIHPCSRQR